MNIVVFASDSKGVASVKNIVKELQNTTHNYFFLYSEETQLQYPTMGLDNFSYDSNVKEQQWMNIWSDTLNVSLPFIPDVLLIQRDCWQPEQNIIHEFKVKWQAKVAMVEVNSHLVNNPETILEMHSRKNYPQNQIDLCFEHSTFTRQERSKAGFDVSRSVVTGNPKYDNLLKIDVQHCYDKYGIDRNKTQILFYSLINTSRDEMFKCLSNLVDKVDSSKYEIFYKPYPGEPFHEKFRNQFNPFIYPTVKVIYDDIDIYPMAKICDVHVGAISSIMHFPLLLNKRIVNINNICTYLDSAASVEKYLSETSVGIEDSAKFWMRVHDLKSYDDFINLLDIDRVASYSQDIDKFLSVIKRTTLDYDFNLNFLNEAMPDTTELLKLFDDHNDFQASKRIIKELEIFASV